MKSWASRVILLEFVLDSKELFNYPTAGNLSAKKFYDLLRAGNMAHHRAGQHRPFVSKSSSLCFRRGGDVLYIAFFGTQRHLFLRRPRRRRA